MSGPCDISGHCRLAKSSRCPRCTATTHAVPCGEFYGNSIQKTREGCGCPKFLAGRVFRQISMLLKKFFPDFAAAPNAVPAKVGLPPATKFAAGKPAPPSGMLLDFSSETATAS